MSQNIKLYLLATYGGTPEEWSKCVGKITSVKYTFDVHWYQYGKKQYETKLKTRKDN